MPLALSAQSTVYVKVPVTATVNGAAVDPTTDTVALAFPVSGVTPASDDWHTGSWETSGTTHYARLLVGPNGALNLAAGSFDVWVKVTDNPEQPVNQVDTLTIY